MSLLSDLCERLRALVFRAREERDMEEEMRFHMEMAGRQAFGGMEQHKEEVRDARGTRLLEEFIADIGWSVRTLARRPRFTIIAILTLAIGVGGVTAVFSAVDAVLLRPLPYAQPSQLVRIYSTAVTDPDLRTFVTTPHFVALRSQLAAVSNATAVYTYDVEGADINLGSGAERIRVLRVSADYFSTLGAPPFVGRAFNAGEETSDAHSVILSYDFWLHRFNADPQVLGRQLLMDAVPHTIVGVGPPGLGDPVAGTVDAWLPVNVGIRSRNANTGNHWLTVIARLRPGVSLQQAQTQIDVLGSALAVAYPDARDIRFHIVPLKTDVVGPADRALELMLGAVALVLLLVCVNIANLLLVRGSERGRELAVRTALGASSTRIVRQLLVESGTLAIAGGLVGLLVARIAMTALVRLGASSIPRLEHLSLDPRMLGFALLASSLSALIFGLTPALRAARTDPSTAFREQTAGASARAGHGGLRSALVVAQVALAFMLVVGAGLLMTSLERLRQTPLGVPTDHVFTFRITLPDARFDSVARTRFYETLAERLARIPGVKAAGGISRLPATGRYHQWGATALSGPLAGNQRANLSTENRVVSGDYFTASRIPLVEGRVFDARDDASTPRRIVISRAAAQQFFPGADPIGQRVQAGGLALTDAAVVIGVVGDVAMTVDGATEPYVYYPHRQFAGDRNWALTQVVLTSGPPLAIEPSVRRAVAELDPQLVVEEPATLEDIIGQSSAQRLFTTRVLVAFAAVALALAAVGLFGILSYVVTLRGKEIGIRMALGADGGTIRSMVLRQGLSLTAIGIALGLFGAVSLSKVIASLLFGTSALDPIVLTAAVLFMGLVAAIAAWFPARRATAVDPRTVLQGE